MRVSYNWLKELLPELSAPAPVVAEALTQSGLEIEDVIEFGVGLEAIVLCEVTSVAKHPKRDKLSLVTVNRGNAEQTVVCGADNVPEPGGMVALAPLGTTLPAIGLTLTPREIAGTLSEGMLCSEAELGLAETSEGILVFEAGYAEPGTPLVTAIPTTADVLFEISVTPNRPDALGHIGVARDLAAKLKLGFGVPKPETPERSEKKDLEQLLSIDNQDLERCPHYGAAVVENVVVKPSPEWLRWRLFSLGIRPISNVVDITNLLLLEFGQPMHAFDLSLLEGSKVVVRRARDKEAFTTLDGVARELSPDDLVICDAKKPTALAGVMGGENTEIQATTQHVLLECAYFDPRGVRRSSRRHGLHTESSHRFERGVDWAQIPTVLERAKTLLTQLAEGTAIEGALHAKAAPPKLPAIRLRAERINSLLGVDIEFDDAVASLKRLGLEVSEMSSDPNGAEATVSGATWRPDIALEADLIEEVARLLGFENIPSELPAVIPRPPRSSGRLENRARRAAAELGLNEAVTYGFVSAETLEILKAPKPVVALENPLHEERSVMRTSLLPGLLEALSRARRHGEHNVRLFSVASVVLAPRSEPQSEAGQAARPRRDEDLRALPFERPTLAALLAGDRFSHLQKPEPLDVYDAKGIAVELVSRLAGQRPRVELQADAPELAHLHPRGRGALFVGELQVGVFGPLHPDIVDALDLGGAAQVIEVDLESLERAGFRAPRYQPIPRLPAVTRDIALEVKTDIVAGDVEAVIRQAAGQLCESVELFDLFEGESVADGHRSLAFHVVYRDPKAATDPESARTLTDKEVDKWHQKVVAAAAKQLGAQLRV